jgi:hypothetical protein
MTNRPTLLAAAQAFLDQCDEIHRHPERRQHPNRQLLEDLRAAIERENRATLHVAKLAAAINDAQIRPDELRLGRDLMPVAKRIAAKYGGSPPPPRPDLSETATRVAGELLRHAASYEVIYGGSDFAPVDYKRVRCSPEVLTDLADALTDALSRATPEGPG